jgi:serine/threonine-protein kinase mTOR
MTLDLHYVSPQLEKLTNLDMAVPGSYVAGQTNIITIANFSVKMTVLATKQRPRRFTLRGSDGRDYEFLLKG